MGFDVTVAYIVFFVAALTAGSAAFGAYWTSADHMQEATRDQQRVAEERAHTNMTVMTTTYDGGLDTFTVTIKNFGSTVIDIPSLVYLVDGVYVTSDVVTSATIAGVSSTELWQPMETLEVVLDPVTTSPTSFKLVATSGAAALWRS